MAAIAPYHRLPLFALWNTSQKPCFLWVEYRIRCHNDQRLQLPILLSHPDVALKPFFSYT
jgi:hypothetical protein